MAILTRRQHLQLHRDVVPLLNKLTRKQHVQLHRDIVPLLNKLRWDYLYKIDEAEPLFHNIGAAIDALDALLEWAPLTQENPGDRRRGKKESIDP